MKNKGIIGFVTTVRLLIVTVRTVCESVGMMNLIIFMCLIFVAIKEHLEKKSRQEGGKIFGSGKEHRLL